MFDVDSNSGSLEPIGCAFRSDVLALDAVVAETAATGELFAPSSKRRRAVFSNPFGQGSFGPEILEEYVSTYRDPTRCSCNLCEEYRAAATIDVDHDRAGQEGFQANRMPDAASMGRRVGPPRPHSHMQTTAVRWAYGVNGLRAHRDRR